MTRRRSDGDGDKTRCWLRGNTDIEDQGQGPGGDFPYFDDRCHHGGCSRAQPFTDEDTNYEVCVATLFHKLLDKKVYYPIS